MDTEGCKFVKYQWERRGWEVATARKVPLTNSIYITFRGCAKRPAKHEREENYELESTIDDKES